MTKAASTAPERPEHYIARACEKELDTHGDNFRGAGYTKSQEEANLQYDIMLGVVPASELEAPVSVLDLGCGLAHMLDHVQAQPRYRHVRYSGLELSHEYQKAALARHPGADIVRMDLRASDADLPMYDYIVMNGLFNYRGEIPYEQMRDYWQQMISIAFRHCRKGIAFNVMSKLVDWERADLFHLPFEEMSRFVWGNLSRRFVIRHDYPSFEYTTYVYRSGP